MNGLESWFGVRLLNRTTRSVMVTAAGEALLASVEAPLQSIADAAEISIASGITLQSGCGSM